MVPGDRPLMAIVYKYISKKVLGFIATEGARSNELVVTYLSCSPENYSSVSIFPVLCHHVIGNYFSACNAIDNHNRTWQPDLALDKYWETQSIYFILATKV